MSMRPLPRTFDRTREPWCSDPVVSRLTDDEFWALSRLLARLAASYARRLPPEQRAALRALAAPPEQQDAARE